MRNKENTTTAELTIADILGALKKIKPVFSIAEFCEMHCFTRPLYYELKKQGRGPREMAVGRRRMITQEAAAEWRRRMEDDAADGAAAPPRRAELLAKVKIAVPVTKVEAVPSSEQAPVVIDSDEVA